MSFQPLQVGNQPQDDGGPIVGIDLGTTNSLVAYVPEKPDSQGERTPVILKSREGRSLVPSVVSFGENGQPVVGYAARDRKIRDAQQTVFSAKRLLGRSFEDLSAQARELPYRLLPGEGIVRIEAGGHVTTAIEVSAAILRELKLGAEAALGTSVRRAVVTVPAYFNDSQRQATRTAGRLAGLDVLRIVNEPTAASLAYGLNRKRQGLIAVYDLGGGTFDISILKLHDGIFEVLATNGDSSLGGDDFDQAIAARMAEEARATTGADPRQSPELQAAFLEAAEALKIALSTEERATYRVAIEGRPFEREWTRAEFEAAIAPTLKRTVEPCLRALEDAKIDSSELSDVVLVGGPTRLAAVQRMAREIFGREPNTSVHPDEVVACGAAIQADILAGRNREFLLLDVVPLSLGIETYGGLMSTLIPRNTRIPAVARETFTTFVDRQTAVDVHVLQGERERVADNRSLARFKLKGLEPAPAGMPRVEVSFLIDADGILQVSAKDLKTGNEQSVEVRPSYGLTDAEVEKMLLASMANAEDDLEYRQLVELKNKVRQIVQATEKQLPEARHLLSPDEVGNLEFLLQIAQGALDGEDLAALYAVQQHLSQSTTRLAELLMKGVLSKSVDGQ